MSAFYSHQAIVTKYHGRTNTHAPRMSATAQAGRIYVAWANALSIDENHALAARVFAHKQGWDGPWYGGCLPDGRRAFVTAEQKAW